MFFYDGNSGRLVSIETKNAMDVVESRFTYELDNAGNRTAVTDLDGKRTEYTYDDLNRLEMETIYEPGGNVFTTYYTYSDGGNLLLKELDNGVTQYIYDGFGRLAFMLDKDLNGNLLSKNDRGQTIGVRSAQLYKYLPFCSNLLCFFCKFDLLGG